MKYEPLKLEPEILKFWEKEKIYEKAKKKNKGKKSFYFLDGPPYTSGKVHLGTAWNKSLKDCILRYKRMTGLDVWDRAGYDMHGLPIEHKVQDKFNIKSKDDIPKFGVAKFIDECRKFSVESMHIMNQDFKRLGVWMDFDDAYMPITERSIESIWWLIKEADKKKRLYKGKRPMAWCPSCATALAKHELDYKDITETSIYFKFPLRKKNNSFLVIWTTTPWTIPFNQFIMINPEVEYVKAKVDNELWIVAKELAEHVIRKVAGKKYKVIETVKGKRLEGIEYAHPYENKLIQYKEIKKQSKKAYTVILSDEYVDLSVGSGLVHAASGTGVGADYEVAHANGIKPWSELDDNGYFEESMGPFKGIRAKSEDDKIIDMFEKEGYLAGKEKYTHDYPHCWRCHSKVIFKTTQQWFFKVEDLKDDMIKENENIKWVPEAGFNAFDAWLKNLRDNSITKQRFWGTPLPVWECSECGHYEVLATKKEIEKKAGIKIKDVHKPWIDAAEYDCTRCNGRMKRIPDVMDVWIDPGCASWFGLDYPQNKKLFNNLFPADFILEGIDQYRGWFNVLMVCSMLAFKKPSFKACHVHGFINDAKGRKMSKSMGNIIFPEEVTEKYGADTLRYYMIGGSQPAVDINYNFEDMKVKHKNLMILWNLHRFVLDLAKNLRKNPKNIKIRKSDLGLEEKYIVSKLNSTIRKVTTTYEEYKLNEVPWLVEELFLQLSRTYLQLTREKINDEKGAALVLHTSFNVLLESLRMFTTIAPFISERIYLNLKEAFDLKEESINLFSWPNPDEKLIDNGLEKNFEIMEDVVQSGLAAREKIQLGVRWPLREVVIVTKDEKVIKAVEELEDVIKVQLNVKGIRITKSLPGIRRSVKTDYAKIGPEFGDLAPKIIAKIATDSSETVLGHIEKEGKYKIKVNGKKISILKEHLIISREVPSKYQEAELRKGFIYLDRELDDELEAEGYSREITRRVQMLRKKAGLEKSDRITLFIKSDEELVAMLNNFEDLIKEKVGAKILKISELNPSKKHKHTSKEKVKQKEFELFLG